MEKDYSFHSFQKQDRIASVVDFWSFHFSNEWSLMSEISEFLVARALDIKEASNKDYWTLYDIKYNGIRVEVKETAYCHSWENMPSTARRGFGIEKSYGYGERVEANYKRYNDVYVFCLNTIEDRHFGANPLNIDSWEFYVVRTSLINQLFGNQKSLSLSKIKRLVKNGAAIQCDYYGIKDAIENSFNEEEKQEFAKKRFIVEAKQAVNSKKEKWEDLCDFFNQFIEFCPDYKLLNLLSVSYYYDDNSYWIEYEEKEIEDDELDKTVFSVSISSGWFNIIRVEKSDKTELFEQFDDSPEVWKEKIELMYRELLEYVTSKGSFSKPS